MGECPEDCNALIKLDRGIEFCKENCHWGKRSKGRVPVEKGKNEEKCGKIQKKKPPLKNPSAIYLVLEKDHLEYIKRQALNKSVIEGRIIEVNELIRDLLKKEFPAPTQFDMFGGKK
jgi:hypothetical protein